MRHYGLILAFLLSSPALAQTSADDPPPYPYPAPAPAAPQGPTALDRYQDCFQKMIDSGSTSNAFMRQCLGLRRKQTGTPAEGRRAIGQGEVEAVAMKSLPAFRECYVKLLGAMKDLGLTPQGLVDVRVEVKPNGTVAAVAFETTALSDAGFLSCLKEPIKTWTMPTNPSAPATARLTVGLRFVAGDGAKAKVTLAKTRVKVVGEGEGLSPEDILQVFRSQAPRVRRCYDELLRRKPGVSGRASLEVTVSPKGRVTRVEVREQTLADEGFTACLQAEIGAWRFPRTRNGEPAVVRFPPFEFVPAAGGRR